MIFLDPTSNSGATRPHDHDSTNKFLCALSITTTYMKTYTSLPDTDNFTHQFTTLRATLISIPVGQMYASAQGKTALFFFLHPKRNEKEIKTATIFVPWKYCV